MDVNEHTPKYLLIISIIIYLTILASLLFISVNLFINAYYNSEVYLYFTSLGMLIFSIFPSFILYKNIKRLKI